MLSRIEMQCRRRQRDADRVTDRQPSLVVHQVLVRSDPDRIAIEAPRIRGLDDLPAQHQAAVVNSVERTEPRLLAAKVRHGRGAAGEALDASGEKLRRFDRYAAI